MGIITVEDGGTVVIDNEIVQVVEIATQGPQGPSGSGGAGQEGSTGLISGGTVSINSGDSTKFDVSAGTGVIIDTSDPSSVTRTVVSWDAKTAVTPTYIANFGTTFLLIDSNGDVVQQTAFPTSPNVRNYIQIGSIVHPDNATITGVSQFVSAPIFNVSASLNDLMVALGVINVSGNNYSGSANANLRVTKSAGVMFYFGIQGKSSATDPNNITTPLTAEPNLLKTWRDGVGGFNTAFSQDVSAGVYDNNGGGVSAPTDTLTSNRWVNHRLYYSPDANTTVLQYGQTSYTSDTAAIAGLQSEGFSQNPSFAGVPFRAILTMRGGAADLTNIADGVFTNANRLGMI